MVFYIVNAIFFSPPPFSLQEVHLEKQPGEKLGMIIKGGLQGQPGNPDDTSDEGVFISKINPDGMASQDPRMRVGQRIIEVNGLSLLGATHQEAVAALRSAGDSLHILLCDGFTEKGSEGIQVVLSGSDLPVLLSFKINFPLLITFPGETGN